MKINHGDMGGGVPSFKFSMHNPVILLQNLGNFLPGQRAPPGNFLPGQRGTRAKGPWENWRGGIFPRAWVGAS